MENYQFNVRQAQKSTPIELAVLLTGLIEVQYQATLYRNSLKYKKHNKSKLLSWGICSNVNTVFAAIMPVDLMYLGHIFFKSLKYPILPYEPTHFCTDNQEFRWGFNPRGDLRMKMLELMIKDLTEYLTKHAV